MGLDLARTGLNTIDRYNTYHNISYEQNIGVGSQKAAAGTTQATANVMPNTQTFFEVTSATSNQGLCLPQSQAGDTQAVLNNSGATIIVYTNPLEVGANQINATAGATGLSQTNGTNALFFCATQGQWYRISGT